ncbi:MAG: immunoglobulin domain-containing protein [Planctomycetota bacterium]
MMLIRAFCVASLGLASTAAGQSPFELGRTYGIGDASADFIYSFDRDGTPNVFTLSTPGFARFIGLEFDAPRDRVVFMANIASGRTIGAIDADLDPSSAIFLRSGLDPDAVEVDVDPATGRIYWWENNQIVSVDAQGNGTPRVEANNVPIPFALEIDTQRGRYFGTDTSADMLFTGALDPLATPTIRPPVSTAFSANAFDIAIDPVTGDLVWIETALELNGDIATSAIRSGPDFLNPTVVVGSTTPSPTNNRQYLGVSALNDLIAVASIPFGTSPGIAQIEFFDTAAGTVDSIPAARLTTMDTEAITDPIISQPQSVVTSSGSTIELSVRSLDLNPTFQWRKNRTALVDDARITGARSATLRIRPTQLTDTDTYQCLVTTSAGEQQLSDAAILAVRGELPPAECPADQNFDGMLTPADFTAWVLNYNAGCP